MEEIGQKRERKKSLLASYLREAQHRTERREIEPDAMRFWREKGESERERKKIERE